MGTARTTFNQEVADDDLTYRVIGCAIEVHKVVGCGLLESAYEEFLSLELVGQGLSVLRQVALPVTYKNHTLQLGYKPDLVIERELIVELKTVSKLLPVHEAQVLTYMRLSRIEKGLLINFHAYPLKNGIRRFILSRTDLPQRSQRSQR